MDLFVVDKSDETMPAGPAPPAAPRRATTPLARCRSRMNGEGNSA